MKRNSGTSCPRRPKRSHTFAYTGNDERKLTTMSSTDTTDALQWLDGTHEAARWVDDGVQPETRERGRLVWVPAGSSVFVFPSPDDNAASKDGNA